MTTFDSQLTRTELLQRAAKAGIAVGALGVVSLPQLACGGSDDESGSPSNGQVVIGEASTPVTLDPDHQPDIQSADAIFNTYDQLVSFKLRESATDNVRPAMLDDVQDLEPRLAEDWSYSSDNRTLTFKLRQGVMSAAENELTSEDVKFSFDTAEKTEAQRSFIFFLGQFAAADVKVIDRYTFSITSRSPNPMLLPGLSIHLATIYDSTEFKKHQTADDPYAAKWLATHTAGFGAYTIRELTAGQQVVFEANPSYYLEPPAGSPIIYRAVPEASNRLALLERGDAQLGAALAPRELQQAPKRADYVGNQVLWVNFNFNVPPFENKNVRYAMAFATPYEAILESVYLGDATPSYGPVASIVGGNRQEEFWKYSYDPAEARRYLSRAGLSNGFEVELAYSQAHPLADQVAVQLKSAWDQVGIRTRLLPMNAATYAARTQSKELPLWLQIDSSFIPDTAYTCVIYFRTDSINNYGNYNNPMIDELSTASLSTLDSDARAEIGQRIQEILVDDLPWLMLAQPGFHKGLANPLGSVGWYPHNTTVFRDFSLVD